MLLLPLNRSRTSPSAFAAWRSHSGPPIHIPRSAIPRTPTTSVWKPGCLAAGPCLAVYWRINGLHSQPRHHTPEAGRLTVIIPPGPSIITLAPLPATRQERRYVQSNHTRPGQDNNNTTTTNNNNSSEKTTLSSVLSISERYRRATTAAALAGRPSVQREAAESEAPRRCLLGQ